MTLLRIATRGSDLALAQANVVAARIRAELGTMETELVIIKTTGDRLQDVSLAKIGGKGLFVKEIEEALLAGRADIAVHSAKDLPAKIAPGLALVAFPERADPRDALVSRDPTARIATLRDGARVGTGSPRRGAQLLAQRPDLEIVPLRGNVPTRIAKLEPERLDAVVLAAAGLDRLGLAGEICERIEPGIMLPAVCQGTLAVEARAGDDRAGEVAALDDPQASVAAASERAFLLRLAGDCTLPLAVYAEWTDAETLRVRGLLASHDGRRLARGDAVGAASEAEALGRRVAEAVLADGGAAILAEIAGEKNA